MQKILGCMYGQLIGDALGTRYEFSSSHEVQQKVKNDIEDNQLNILGDGPFHLLPGQVTDDSELALGLLVSIINNKGYQKEAVAKKYIKWFQSNPFDIGRTTRFAFERANNYQDIIKNSQFNSNSLSNGCLMRISPLGIYGIHLSNQLLLQYAEQDCKMTNPNPIAIDAVKVYVIAIKSAIISNGNKSFVYQNALSTAKTPLIKTILTNARRFPEPVITTDGTQVTTDSSKMGYLGIALQNTFYELLHGQNFENSLINIIRRGGDTDTNGCIAGALLGAIYGIHQIPQNWITTVKECQNPRTKVYPEVDQSQIKKYATILVKI